MIQLESIHAVQYVHPCVCGAGQRICVPVSSREEFGCRPSDTEKFCENRKGGLLIMFTKRIIPCLDVHDGRVVKGVNFVNLQDAGDPVEIAKAYDKAGADEVVFLDITASSDDRATVVDMVRKVAANVFIPFTVGGGIRTVDDFKMLLREGADKISINSSAINNPELIRGGIAEIRKSVCGSGDRCQEKSGRKRLEHIQKRRPY